MEGLSTSRTGPGFARAQLMEVLRCLRRVLEVYIDGGTFGVISLNNSKISRPTRAGSRV